MTAGRILLDVAVILVAARVGGALFERAGQPGVIGQIVAGIALGPTVLGALPGDPSSALFPESTHSVLHAIGQLGLALFMFAVGWDLNLRLVRRRERAAISVSIASIALPFALGLGLAAYLHPRHAADVPFWPFALFVGASLSLTAFPVLARILEQTGLAATGMGAVVLSAAAVDDLIGWSILAVALAVLTSGGAWDYVRIVVETALFVAAIVVVMRPLLRHLVASASPLRQGLVLPCALAGAYATDAIGMHAVFGAFLIGAAMPRPPAGELALLLRRNVSAAVGLLVPIYFVGSGMAVDIPGLHPGDVGALALILTAACAGKFLGALGGGRAAGVELREAAAIGILMNTRGLIEIVLLTVGRERGLIDDRLFTLFALMAIATTLATTPLLRRVAPLGQTPRGSARTRTTGEPARPLP
jgi:Kef-type K+ transport system membrane component KefB